MAFIVFLKSSLSSALSIASISVPSSLTPYFSSVPSLDNCMAIVKPVCPPRPAKSPSGRSFTIILLIVSALRVSRYILFARFLSVIIVAGFELTKTVLIPSSLRTRQACAPA